MKICVRGGLRRRHREDADRRGRRRRERRHRAVRRGRRARCLVERWTRSSAGGDVREWLPRAFARFCRRRPLHAVDTRGYPWIEIDFPEDYWRACSDVLPAIDGRSTRAATGAPAAARGAGAGEPLHHV